MNRKSQSARSFPPVPVIIPHMNPIPRLISKTKLMRGYRCLKCIYLTIHEPALEAPVTPDLQALFDQGNLVGDAARKQYAGGELVDNKPWDFTGALARTRELITAGSPIIYEAAFEYMGCYARADIIQYSPETKRWRIYEVKSTTKVKPEHLDDVGLQAWIMAKSGLPLEKIHIVHLNPDCRHPDLTHLFVEVDVTERIRENYLEIKPKVKEILTVIRQETVPDIDIGPYCLSPTECGFTSHCWPEKKVPETSIFNLPGLREKKWQLYYEGIIQLDDPRLRGLNDLQERIVTCFKTGERYLDRDAVRSALAAWKFPLVFLDFETINPAIPRFAGCHPFQHIPFQFSVHVWQSPDSAVTHLDFLHEADDDPRPSLISALLDACQTQGSILAYYSKFESDRIRELADFSSEHSEALVNLLERLADPLEIIRASVYDNAFAGSFSLKRVAPALLGQAYSYEDMLVANGGDAQRAYEELVSARTSPERKKLLKKAMLDYCEQDTRVMVELVKWLFNVCRA
ncbi:hypothetical protein AQUSIP_08950 [Aquicella siphonis]|uniref:DUF2779 domain-containing protein n=1 Tax=Aquicella siphonis TaxID=254247 RepID=A0A5E4PG41_9COXI|nr:DUF2779 domain-containing protein [Aquicella siphonis]VVC75605.1 hypothetical protein AQUSIP_08950 [Aquicella siphonis]